MRYPVELVDAARTGGSRDVERLLEAVWPDAYRLAMTILGHPQSAQDAAQEACAIMFRGIRSLRNPDAFRTWCYRIVVREALKLKQQPAPAAFLVEGTYCEDPGESIDLLRALAALPDALRTVVVLRYFEDLSSREIGGVLRIPDATVRFRLMTAKRRLQQLLQANETPGKSKGELYAL